VVGVGFVPGTPIDPSIVLRWGSQFLSCYRRGRSLWFEQSAVYTFF
jgi:hypothetical protein